jgi:hypothetical protein
LAQLLHVAGQLSAARLLSSALRAYGIRREGKDEENQVSTSAWQHRDAQPIGSGLSAEQLSLLYDERTLDEKFAAFHKAHPEVYKKLVGLAREVRGAGHEHCSIDFLMHRLRWYYHIELKTKEAFKVNNSYSSRYARYIMQFEPDLVGMFEVRKLRG